VPKDVFSSVVSLHRTNISILNVKYWHFYICITCNTGEFVTSTECPPNSLNLNPLDYNVGNKLKKLVCKNQKEPFHTLELLEEGI
jgi:hypothetical protein